MSELTDGEQVSLIVIKVMSMITFFLMILIVGSLPLRLKAFKENKKLLALTAAFSGGLFISVGMIHLLPEAAEDFIKYQTEQDYETEGAFPFAYLITVMSFTLILFIEKIAAADSHHHHSRTASHGLLHQVQDSLFEQPPEIRGEEQEDDVKQLINTQITVAKKVSFAQHSEDPKLNPLAPYILQIAIGIHAVFEGIAIGILNDVSLCLGIALAVAFHKWAEGLTLGLAFRQAQVELKMSTIMITIQAIMNPIGVGMGWLLADAGPLTSGIFVSISAGTFVYIATVEVIVEEFSITRYKWEKFGMFCFAVCFICSIWFLEKWTEG